MRTKLAFVVGAAIGYVLGARAGRQRYEQISDLGARVAATPPVQRAKEMAAEQATHVADQARQAASEAASNLVAEGKHRLEEGRHKIEEALGDRLPERLRTDDGPADEPAPGAPLRAVDGTATDDVIAGPRAGAPDSPVSPNGTARPS